MKKILSIFSIGAVLSSGTIFSGGGIACGSSAKTFDLNSIKLGDDIVGLKQQNSAIEINGKATYSKVETEIINQYNAVVKKDKLTSSSFVINSKTPTSTSPWAIEITNGNVKVKNTTTSDLEVEYNKPLASKTNSLNVAITTTDPNVVTKSSNSDAKSVNIPLYFKKYIFSGQDANNGDAIKLPKTGDTISDINLKQNDVVGLSATGFRLINQNATNLASQWNHLSGTTQNSVYSQIVNAVNAKFATYMKNVKSVTKVSAFSTTNPVGDNTIAASKLKYFAANKKGNITVFQPTSTQPFAHKEDIYVAIPVYDWTYLTKANYLSNSDTYVYAYLGKATRTFNLDTISLNNNVIAKLANKAATTTEDASITINGGTTYSNIITQIIAQYKHVFPNLELDKNKFRINSTSPTTEKPWAIEITNGDVKVDNSAASDLEVHYDKPLANGNNSLNVTITTTDPNVVVNSNNKKTNTLKIATIKAYFHKYIFTTQDANNNDAIKLPTTGDTISDIKLTQSAVVDLNGKFNFNALSVNNLVDQWNNLAGEKQIIIYNKIVNAVNAKFNSYMIHTPHIAKVATFSDDNPVGTNNINASEIKIFEADSNGEISVFNNHASDSFGAGQNLYFAIPVSSWGYLTHANYFSNSDTYVFAKLGTATSKFDLNSITLPNDVIADLTMKARTGVEAASMTINGHQTYANVENAIINSYNTHFGGRPLSDSDFTFNSIAPTTEYPWAIKITNGSVDVQNNPTSDLQVWFNKPLASQTNSLNVQITTNDPNVVVNSSKKSNNNKTVTVNAYFDNYIFTTQDANNDDGINIPANGKTIGGIRLDKTKILQWNENKGFDLTSKDVPTVLAQWDNLTGNNLISDYNDVLNRVNAKFSTYMADITSPTKAQPFADAASIANFKILSSKFKIFEADPTSGAISMHSTTQGTLTAGRDVFIAIPVFDWQYLTNAHYFSNDDTYVYAFLGTTPSS